MTSKQPVAASFQDAAPLRSRQPFALIWTIFSGLRFLASTPFLFLYFSIPSNRGTPQRLIKQEMSFSMLRAVFKWVRDVRYEMPRPLSPSKGWKDQFVLFEPTEDSAYQGVAKDLYIKPEPVPGVWYPRRPDPSELRKDRDGPRVVMHFHGGAYATGQYEPEATEIPSRAIAEKLSSFVLCAGHRKSSRPGCHFPTQLQDAITTYGYLLQQGVKPVNIIFSGNSSGGHMAFNLLRYLIEHPASGLPKPAAIVASSPWVDMLTSDYSAMQKRSNYNKDYVDLPFILWCRNTFLPPGVDIAKSPYLSLLHHLFDLGGVPAWVLAGEDELVLDETYQFVAKLREIPRNDVDLYVAPDSPHDVMWTGPMLGFLKESQVSCDKLAGFMKSRGW